jgi:hypothetical protein
MIEPEALRKQVNEQLASLFSAAGTGQALYHSTQAICTALLAIHEELVEVSYALEGEQGQQSGR